MNDNYLMLKSWHNEFNIRSFFDKDNPRAKTTRNSACALVTENQVVNVLCNGNGDGNHYTTMNMIAKYLLRNDEYNTIVKLLFTNIEIRMINELEQKRFIILLPNRISFKQYQMLDMYLQKVSWELQDILKHEKIFYFDDEIDNGNNIEEILTYARARINDNYVPLNEKVIIGYTLNENFKR